MRAAALAVAAVIGVAAAGCNGDGDGKPASTTRAPSRGARATVVAFYTAAGREDFPAACALLAPQADAPQTTANLIIAISSGGRTFMKLGTDCESTLSALANSQPWLLEDMVLDVRAPSAAAPGKVDISGGDNRVTFHATLVQVDGVWRILSVGV